MAIFAQYQGGDAFNVGGNMDAVLKEQQNTHQSMLDAVNKFSQARDEMSLLQQQTQSILAQYDVDEKGKPSDSAPKYVHDLYKSVNKEGGVTGLSRTNLISALKGYEAGVAIEEQRMKVKSAQQSIAINDLNLSEAQRKADEAKKIAVAHRLAWDYGSGESETPPSGTGTAPPRGILTDGTMESPSPRGIPRDAVNWSSDSVAPTPSMPRASAQPIYPSAGVTPPTGGRIVPELPDTASKTLEDKTPKDSPTYERDKLESRLRYERSIESIERLKQEKIALEKKLSATEKPEKYVPVLGMDGMPAGGSFLPKSLETIEEDKREAVAIRTRLAYNEKQTKEFEAIRQSLEKENKPPERANQPFEEPRSKTPVGATPVAKKEETPDENYVTRFVRLLAEKQGIVAKKEETPNYIAPEFGGGKASLERAEALKASVAKLDAIRERQKNYDIATVLESKKGKERTAYVKQENLEKRTYVNADGWTKAELESALKTKTEQVAIVRKAREIQLSGDKNNLGVLASDDKTEYEEGSVKWVQQQQNKRFPNARVLSGIEADAKLALSVNFKNWLKNNNALAPDGLMRYPTSEERQGKLPLEPVSFWVNKWVESEERIESDLKTALKEKRGTDKTEGSPKYNTTYFRKGSTEPILQNDKIPTRLTETPTETPTLTPEGTPVPSSIAPNATSVPTQRGQTSSAPVNPAMMNAGDFQTRQALPISGTPEQKSEDEKITEEFGIITSRLKSLNGVPLNWSEETYRQMRGYAPKVRISKQNGVTIVGIGGQWQVMKGESMSPSEMATMEKHMVWKDSIRTDRMSNKKFSFRGDIRVDNANDASKVKQSVQDVMVAINALDRLIELGDTGFWDSVLPNEKSAIIIGVTNSIQAAARTEVAGSGAFSEEDAKRLDKVIPDLSSMSGTVFRESALSRLKEVRTRMTNKIKGISSAYGFEVGETSNTGLTPDQEAIARNVFQTAKRQGKSDAEARALALESIK
jgi:hypothetical protein